MPANAGIQTWPRVPGLSPLRPYGEGLGVGRRRSASAEATICRPREPHPRPLPVKNGEGRLPATASWVA